MKNRASKTLILFTLCFFLIGTGVVCRSGETVTRCPTYYRNVAFGAGYLPAPAPASADEEIEPDYLDRMYEGIQDDFEDSDIDLDETATGFAATGIQLSKKVGDDGYTRELTVALDGDIAFASGSAALSPKVKELIGKIAAGMHKYPNTLIRIGGHTDSVGSFRANKILSRRRAESVEAELITRHNISPRRIREVKGFADLQKIEQTNGPSAKNRRIEIVVVSGRALGYRVTRVALAACTVL